MKTSAILYIRVSTDEQADTGFSQRSQEEMLNRYCSINGITVKATYIEDYSAKTFDRPEFKKLLLTYRKHRGIADLLLFTKWDRFSRNAGDAYGMISTLNKLGVEPQAIEQPLDLSIPENKLMLAFFLAAPQVENERRSLNVIAGMRRARSEGNFMGTAPKGYLNKVSEDGKKYIAPNPLYAPVIQWIFQEIASAKFTTEAIMKKANEMGLNTSKNNFWHILRNPLYCGKIQIKAYKNEEERLVTGKHEPLITEALFFQVQDILDGKKKIQRTKITVDDRFPLRGFIVCSCGKLLTASSSKGRKEYYSYYHCTSECGIRHKADIANGLFIKELSKWKPHPAIKELYKIILENVFGEENRQKATERRQVRNELDRYKQRLEKARDLLICESIEADDFKAIKKECEKAIIRLEGQWTELAMDEVNLQPLIGRALGLLENIDQIYSSATTDQKREIIGSMFPGKLTFDGEAFRTERINEAVRVIFNLGTAFSEIKMGQVQQLSDLSQEVNWLGLEPRAHTLKVYCSTN